MGRRLTAKLTGQFTQLRQQCCHPQIVRRDVWLGKARLSMRQILTRLVTRAFNDYDAALRNEYSARLLLAAVQLDEMLSQPRSDGETTESKFHSQTKACDVANQGDSTALAMALMALCFVA